MKEKLSSLAEDARDKISEGVAKVAESQTVKDARTAGENVIAKAADSSTINKIANNKTVSKVVDNETVKKISTNKNKRVLVIGAALAVVALIVVIGGLFGGGGSGGSCTLEKAAAYNSISKIKAVFEGYYYETQPKITVGEGHISVKSGGKTISGHQVIVTGPVEGLKGADNRFLVTDNSVVYYYNRSTKNWEYSEQFSLDKLK